MSAERRIIPIRQAQQVSLVQEPKRTASGLLAPPPLTLYIHVPWCVRKCPYCDFNSHEAPEQIPEDEYVNALISDLEQSLPLVWGRQVHAIFFGGGTPSLLSAEAVDRILTAVRSHLSLWVLPEITLEANPGTAEAERFKGYAQAGISRLSLGLQALNDDQLKALGRIHDAREARAAIDMALQTFERVNLDFMYGLPGQSLGQWRDTLTEIRGLGDVLGHLSLYQLSIEPNTVFAKYPPKQPDDDIMADMEEVIMDVLAPDAWAQYEVSAYAKPGHQCQHNLNYWRFGDYLGIGPGAHTKLSLHDQILRQVRTRSPVQWMQNVSKQDGSHVSQSGGVERDTLPFEFMLNALRLKEGVSADVFEGHTGLPLSSIKAPLDRAMDAGLLSPDPTRIVSTELGFRHLTTLQSMFLPEEIARQED